jgi:outer membrane biosynthesis protein TonB
MSDRRRLSGSALLALAVLTLISWLVPPPDESEGDTLRVRPVRLALRQPTRPLPPAARLPEADDRQAFVPQHTDGDRRNNPAASTADTVSRKVDRETVAERPGAMSKKAADQPLRLRPSPESKPAPAPTGGPRLAQPQRLRLDLDWLQPVQPTGEAGRATFELAGEVPGQGAAWPNSDLPTGPETWLSSQAVRFGGFYRRMHQAIAGHWQPGAVLERRDPSGRLYGTADRHTVLHVRLDRRGRLAEKPAVLHSSGLGVLDREAVRAVVAAAPFPNPPSALARSGIIDLGKLSFYVEIDRGTFFIRRAR